MEQAIAEPRKELSQYAPRMTTIKIPVDMIGAVIGPGGKMIKSIVQQTGAEVNIEDDGTVVIAAVSGESSDKAREMIERLVESPEVGKTYKGTIKRMMDFGVFVEFLPWDALWTHPNAVLHIGAVAVLLVMTYKGRAFTSRYSWSFAAALLIALLPYLIYVIANDARNSFSTFYLQLDNRTSSLAQQNWLATSLRGEWNRIVEYAQFPYRAPIVLVFASVWVRSLVSKKIETRNVAIVVGMYILLSILVISNKTVLYTSSVLPMLCVLAAVNTDELLGAPQEFGERIRRIFHSGYFRESLGVGLFVLLSLNQLAGDTRLLWRNRNCSYTETIKQLQTVIPPDARVWGSITFWFGFQHQPLRTQYTHLREVDTFKPEYMITGDAEIWGKDFWKSVRDDADAVIEKRGTLVAEFPENCYGTLRVYHLRW